MPNLSTLSLPSGPSIPVNGVDLKKKLQPKALKLTSTGQVEQTFLSPKPSQNVTTADDMFRELGMYPTATSTATTEDEMLKELGLPQRTEQKSWLDEMKSVNPINLGIGALKGVGSSILSIGEIGSKALESGYNATIAKLTGRKAFDGSGMAKEAKESDALKRKNLGQKLGFGAEQLAELFVPVPGGAKTKLVSGAAKLAGNSPKLARFAELGGKAVAEAADMGAKTYLQTASGEDAASAAKFGAAGTVAGELLAPLSTRLSNAIFSRTIPTTPLQAGRDLSKGLNIGEAVGSTGISASRRSLMEKLQSRISELGGQLGKAIDETVTMNPKAVTTIEDVTARVKERIIGDKILQKRLQATPIMMDDAINTVEDTLKRYNELYKGKELNVRDLQKIKVDLGSGLEKQFQMALDAPVKAQKLAEISLRQEIRKLIEKNVPLASELNQKLAPLNEASKRIAKKGPYSGYITDIMVGGLSAGNPTDILSDPAGYFKRFVAAVLFKRAATSTLSKTAAATILRDVDRIVASPGFTQLLRKLFDEPLD